ncbi:A/G-specific adenine glycosylase [Sulfuricurvum sp.]|uniref:A/G-specific adenine glycosylase n=1 Tax=Sulfuricurvum sp. TaxID=2025608 RepID=UPI00263713B0|nr:A/G-specific adenine glycosylase [Sulfuricurvum sp.]MDD2266411.1 A/G-specific adenine glycosylase [Sulfuricurvum sp.]MDD2784959.1 A/G-specific adenine glycosylase [Sulfuricurvum sp.]
MNTSPHATLLQWYADHGRHDLPWRTNPDPYAIYVSEIMLQQTQVKTVLERFYFPFLERFPTLTALAEADLDDVLKMWEGLGYYTRARNLYAAARQCNGQLPDNALDLLNLPGIGQSTAHAIAAFAYREPLPIMDANVKRILHRYYALTERNDKKLWDYAYTLFDSAHPFEYNQAMMDIGATICLPKKPLCPLCPLEKSCLGKTSPLAYPASKAKKIKPVRFRNIIVYQKENRYALIQRRTRFLSGLWSFYESEDKPDIHMKYLGEIIQNYSHFTLEAHVYLCTESVLPEGYEWFSVEEIAQLSLSRADHKVVSLL